MAEREGQNVQWIELEPSVEAINLCDFIWKPFNYQKIVITFGVTFKGI